MRTIGVFARSQTLNALAAVFVFSAGVVAWGRGGNTSGAEAWRYVVPPIGEPFSHPPLAAVVLSRVKPAELRESAEYHGLNRWYGLLRFGSANSTRVALVVDQGMTANSKCTWT